VFVFRGYLSRVKQYVMQPQSVVRNKECETQLGVCEKRPFYRKLIYLLLSCSIAYLLLQWIADKYTRFVIINRVNINYNLFFFFRRSWYFCSNEARYCHCFLWRDDYFSRQFWNLQLTSKLSNPRNCSWRRTLARTGLNSTGECVLIWKQSF